MQKFTAFSILLSIIVVLATVDVLFHGYLGGEQVAAEDEAQVDEENAMDTPVDTEVDSSVNPVDEEVISEVSPDANSEADESVELQEVEMESWITGDLLSQAGFMSPVVKEALFSGLIFQIIPFNDGADSQTLQLNFFDGETYVGTFYEIVYATDTGSFQGYLNLREAAKSLTELGTVNEINMYGDASFYFNHKSKVNTVHMVALYGKRIYGFEYASDAHEKMKKMFDNLSTLQ